MDPLPSSITQKIAHAARACEQRQTKQGRDWVAVFLLEDTIVIALHGSLTTAEQVLVQSPAGVTQVRAFHQHLFTNVSATLVQDVKRITGMEVRDTEADILETTGSVVQVLTTDTMREKFLLAPDRPGGARPPRHGPPRRHADSVRPAARKPKNRFQG
jgi:uncharacterized protein YbcI